MKNPAFNRIVQAIDVHRLIAVQDEAGVRVIEPYLIFESAKGDMLLHGWQRSGAYRSLPPPRWCNLHLDDIVSVDPLPGRFAKPHEAYNPHSPNFHRVIYEIDPDRARTTHSSPSQAAAHRLARPRRKGPPKRLASRNGAQPRAPRSWRR